MFDSPDLILDYLVSASFLHAAGMTLMITLVSMAWGMLIGLLIALGQEWNRPGLNVLIVAYLWLFRGTPVLFQIIFIFNVLPAMGILFSGFTSAVLALALNEAAYIAEIFRSGIEAVGKGQRTAGRSLGMKNWQVMRHIVLPQALRTVIPPIGNQFLGMLKLSALVSVIGVEDLLLTANQTASANFRYFEALTAAGVFYLAMTTLFMFGQSWLERKVNPRRGNAGATKGKSLTQRLLGMTANTGA
ncbi:amino acid ABC transporter permease [Roseospira marina]|uniref:Glutamate/aspartate import permease protein GltK n=1 Tax=Roseospira marina TaxID=140057 RepID=A0A5M6IG90_9PROT|nr:amino acid ABC transporter permease [Roseospira marina]KAA5606598.1 amino acid ABC transporter permease [Roseospira marina]MBB4314002.1 polar amino acid transport system permease protein [Roseospira marina]MBB5087164.1 polar amino acid transport system permease protein [Roseospira marina]